MNYSDERIYLLKKMAVSGKLLIAGGVTISVMAAVNGSAWAFGGLAVAWLGYSTWQLQRPYYKNGHIRSIESVDDFKTLPKRHLKKPDQLLTGSDLKDFYTEFEIHTEAISLLKNKDITHHLAINTELLIRQYYEPLLKIEHEQAVLSEIKEKIDTLSSD